MFPCLYAPLFNPVPELMDRIFYTRLHILYLKSFESYRTEKIRDLEFEIRFVLDYIHCENEKQRGRI